MAAGRRFPHPALVVVKVGSSSLRRDDGLLDREMVAKLAEQLVAVRRNGSRVVLVSSGAVSAGMGLLGLHVRPEDRQLLQTCAAVGQAELINAYQAVLAAHDLSAAQLLLTQDDFVGRGRYLNARETLTTLLDMPVVPVINENDAITFDELAWGDNDHLAALVSSMLDADLLVMLSDVDGLFDGHPADGDAQLVATVADTAGLDLDAIGGAGSSVGSGGMRTKVEAARVVTSSGGHAVVANARHGEAVVDAVAGRRIGTHFVAQASRRDARRLWIGFALRERGHLHVDAGAARALVHGGKSLLAVGITDVDGDFARGACVAIVDPDGTMIGRGLVDTHADAVRRVMGSRSTEAGDNVNAAARPIVHRDRLYVY